MLKKICNITLTALFASILTLSQSVYAEEVNSPEQPEQQRVSGFGFLNTGIGNVNFTTFNSVLQKNNLSQFPGFLPLVGADVQAIAGKFVISGGVSTLLTSTVYDNEKNEMSLDTLTGFFNVGYIVYSNGDFFIYPYVGSGGGGWELKLKDTTANSVFRSIFKLSKDSYEIKESKVVLDLGIGAQYLFNLSNEPGRKNGIALALKAGYFLTIIDNAWKVDGLSNSNVPQISNNFLYMRLMLGAGGDQAFE